MPLSKADQALLLLKQRSYEPFSNKQSDITYSCCCPVELRRYKNGFPLRLQAQANVVRLPFEMKLRECVISSHFIFKEDSSRSEVDEIIQEYFEVFSVEAAQQTAFVQQVNQVLYFSD